MSIKIETRFAPSVVKCAQLLEAIVALSKVPSGHKLRQHAHHALANLTDEYKRHATRLSDFANREGYDIQACYEEMQRQRKIKARLKRERQEELARERDRAMDLIAA